MIALNNLLALLFVALFALGTYLFTTEDADAGAMILVILAFVFVYWG